MEQRLLPIDRRHLLMGVSAACAAPLLAGWPQRAAAATEETYDQDTVLKAVVDFFGNTTEGLARVVEKVFAEEGRPNAFIRGEEAAAALTLGLRYGDGELVMKSGPHTKAYWSGPSIGFDFGANAAKVFMLIYHLPNVSALFERFPGVDGSLYYIGGAGVNYLRRDGITLAPIRLGVGVRSGASVGYLHFRRDKSFNPL